MKLIDILVEELPKRGRWPEGANFIAQDEGRATWSFINEPAKDEDDEWLDNSETNYHKLLGHLPEASDRTTAIITREQYEAALAAKDEGWIEWGGGECPVEEGVLVDVKYRDGDEFPDALGVPALSGNGTGSAFWERDGYNNDIISYRLHKPQQAEQPEASEEDLNECIGQNAAPVWNGEGLPSVGCECERSWAGDEWKQCKILFASNQIVVVKLKESGIEDAYNIGDVTFRPIRSEAERKREKAVQALCNAGGGNGRVDEESGYGSCWFDIYDAIAVGKIPGVNLED